MVRTNLKLDDIASISTGYTPYDGGWTYLWIEPVEGANQQDFSALKGLAKGRGKVLDSRIIAVDPYLRESGDDPFPEGYYIKPASGISFGWKCWHFGEHGAALSQESMRNHILPALAECLGVGLSEINERFVGLVKS